MRLLAIVGSPLNCENTDLLIFMPGTHQRAPRWLGENWGWVREQSPG